jgi:cysteine-rich repeat protein
MDCVQQQCVVVDGGGRDNCSDNAECESDFHLGCFNKQCLSIFGGGRDECNSSAECERQGHLECDALERCVIKLGPGADLCDFNDDCERPRHLECIDQGCIEVEGPGSDLCSVGGDECLQQHTECTDRSMCVAVSGRGDNRCDSPFACNPQFSSQSSGFFSSASSSPLLSHLVCEDEQCIVELGEGDDECSEPEDCIGDTHLGCEELACISIEGAGEDTCEEDPDCERTAHLDCEEEQCIVVSGAGMDLCENTDECEGTHLACDNFQCIVTDGNEEDSCETAADCFRPSPPTFSSSIASSALSLSLLSDSSSSRFSSFSSGVSCAGSNECPGSTLCDAGQCRTGCIDATSCTVGRCNQRGDCETCIENNECSGNRCVRNKCQDCRSSSDCPSGLQCDNGDCIRFVDPNINCGNSIENIGEECDDGNRISGDGCSSECFIESTLVASASICGNGVLEQREECDDSNRRDDDGCSSTCLLEIGICGDGVVQTLLGEQCESSIHNPALAYLCNNCRFLSPTCGDGTIDAGEDCDDGPINSTSPDANCRPDCSSSRCGDGVLDAVELCDDGNRINGDGCDRYCTVEDGKLGVTVIASDTTQQLSQAQGGYQMLQQQFGFPQYPNFQQLPYQLPLAQLQPLMQSQAPMGDTGPAGVAVIGAGAAAGWSWMRRKKR